MSSLCSLSYVATSCILVGIIALLSGCGSETQRCNGNLCDCRINLYSLDANLVLGDVPVEHGSAHYIIPNIDQAGPNGTTSRCCAAIFDTSIGNETADLCDACSASPNSDVASAACSPSDVGSAHGSRDASPIALAASAEGADDFLRGQDCWVEATNGTLAGRFSASLKLRVRWTDPEAPAETPCCEALQPVLSSLFIQGMEVPPQAERDAFCGACKSSRNVAVALAAYRCFGRSDGDSFRRNDSGIELPSMERTEASVSNIIA